MEPISNSNRTSLDEPTPAEIEAGASLPREPEPLESRRPDAQQPSPPAVKTLVDRYRAADAVPAEPAKTVAEAATSGASHPGIALSIGGNIAAGPGIAVSAEGALGVVVDLSEGKISLFTSACWGTAIAPGVSAGVSGQVSGVKDVTKFWGSGAEVGVNLPAAALVPSGALIYSTPEPGGRGELNAITLSRGPSVGGDGHYMEGTTTERWSTSLREIKDVLKRALDPTDSVWVGP